MGDDCDEASVGEANDDGLHAATNAQDDAASGDNLGDREDD